MSKRPTRAYTRAKLDQLAELVELPDDVGVLAATEVFHRFRNLTIGPGSEQCLLCFGWFDDSRHGSPPPEMVPEGKDYGITCPNCSGECHLAIDRFHGGRDYICVRCGYVVVVSEDSIT